MRSKVGLVCPHLAQKQSKPRYGEADTHQSEAGSNPRKKRSFRRKVHSWISFF